MSQRIRHRAGSLTLAVFAAGAGLLWGDAAPARATDGGERVVFTGGGVLGVTCAATPSRSTVTVAADSSLEVVNRTGFPARLLVDGAVRGELGNAESTRIPFSRGPVSLTLSPSCVIAGQPATVRVRVRPAATEQPTPTVATEPSAATRLPAAGATGSAPAGGPDDRATAIPSTRGFGGRTPDAAPRADRGRPPARTDDDRDRTRPAGPPVRPARPAPASPAATGAADTDSRPSDQPAVDPTAAQPDDGTAIESVVATKPVGRSRPVGLLPIIAVICVVGVSCATIRAIVAQRASRTKIT